MRRPVILNDRNITVNSKTKKAALVTASHHKGIIKKIDRYTNDLIVNHCTMNLKPPIPIVFRLFSTFFHKNENKCKINVRNHDEKDKA